jgi:hypothetical protein
MAQSGDREDEPVPLAVHAVIFQATAQVPRFSLRADSHHTDCFTWFLLRGQYDRFGGCPRKGPWWPFDAYPGILRALFQPIVKATGVKPAYTLQANRQIMDITYTQANRLRKMNFMDPDRDSEILTAFASAAHTLGCGERAPHPLRAERRCIPKHDLDSSPSDERDDRWSLLARPPQRRRLSLQCRHIGSPA